MTKGIIFNDLLEVSRKLGLPVKKLLDTLYYLKEEKRIPNNTLLEKVGVSKNVLNQTKQSLASLFGDTSEFTTLSAQGLSIAQKLIAEAYVPEEKLIGVLEQPIIDTIEKVLILIGKHRPKPLRKFDQFTATANTVGRRAVLMDFFADILGKRILFLGDDDFTSLAVAFLGKAQVVVAADIDKRILDSIQNCSDKLSCQIHTREYDARQVLLSELAGKFDVVFTDPPYTPEGVSLFLSRATSALDPTNQAARIYLCYGNSDRAKERYLPVYESIISSGLMIRWVFDKFNRYSGGESIGSASSLFICDVTPKTRPLIKGVHSQNIYTE